MLLLNQKVFEAAYSMLYFSIAALSLIFSANEQIIMERNTFALKTGGRERKAGENERTCRRFNRVTTGSKVAVKVIAHDKTFSQALTGWAGMGNLL
jgi:hypothetical protein